MAHKSKMIFLLFPIIIGCAHVSKVSNISNQSSLPKGIRYKACDSITNQKAIDKLTKVLRDSTKSGVKWFDQGVGCLPFLWKQLSKNPYFVNADGAKMWINVPFSGGSKQYEGKSFRKQADFDSLQSYIVNMIKNDGPVNIRKPTSSELQLYWGFITFDIEEPIFTMETKSHKILVNFYNGYILQLEDYFGVEFLEK